MQLQYLAQPCITESHDSHTVISLPTFWTSSSMLSELGASLLNKHPLHGGQPSRSAFAGFCRLNKMPWRGLSANTFRLSVLLAAKSPPDDQCVLIQPKTITTLGCSGCFDTSEHPASVHHRNAILMGLPKRLNSPACTMPEVPVPMSKAAQNGYPCLPGSQPKGPPMVAAATSDGRPSSSVTIVSFQRFRNPNRASVAMISTTCPSSKYL